MKKNIIVYGVHNWPNREPTKEEIDYCNEWYQRVIQFVPYLKKVIVTTGNYCNIKHSPFPKEVEIVQNKIPYTEDYSNRHSYFRNGFMTGIWHALLNENDWDILFHLQVRVLVGVPLKEEFDKFIDINKHVMSPKYTQMGGSGIEIGIFAMKKWAVMKYATSAIRQSFVMYNDSDINCEHEAFVMFSDTWYNPWKHILTTRQKDFFLNGREYLYNSTPFCIFNENYILQLPFISQNKKHSYERAIELWKQQYPLK